MGVVRYETERSVPVLMQWMKRACQLYAQYDMRDQLYNVIGFLTTIWHQIAGDDDSCDLSLSQVRQVLCLAGLLLGKKRFGVDVFFLLISMLDVSLKNAKNHDFMSLGGTIHKHIVPKLVAIVVTSDEPVLVSNALTVLSRIATKANNICGSLCASKYVRTAMDSGVMQRVMIFLQSGDSVLQLSALHFIAVIRNDELYDDSALYLHVLNCVWNFVPHVLDILSSTKRLEAIDLCHVILYRMLENRSRSERFGV